MFMYIIVGGIDIKLEIVHFKGRRPRSEMKLIMHIKSTATDAPYISRSYSAEYAALIRANFPISVDIERRKVLSMRQRSTIIQFACNCEDRKLLDRGIDLLQIWTLKEAYAKYLYQGLRMDFAKIYICQLNDLVYQADYMGFNSLAIQSWLTEYLAISVAAEIKRKECFLQKHFIEGVVEYEH